MGSLLEEPARREAAAREWGEAIGEQIERLHERLAAEEEGLSRLVIARETVRRSPVLVRVRRPVVAHCPPVLRSRPPRLRRVRG
ncbi:hypothetical protein [Nonomuraea turcica]|uniref:hypothetical protein n=1 Tax=Nonomuraea sp. G32 TaxID=3067274 RepID=UPI00273AF056|nr:hypothetical protein [Nonomuraea sp. G32]MDP4510269.1 hypothetical protein [Nonomuraea sp. G32]